MLKRLLVWFSFALAAAPLEAQQPPAPAQPTTTITVCGQQVPAPRLAPPANSGPVVLFIAPCFEAQGNTSLIDIQTYLFYIHLKASQPSQGVWVPYDAKAEQTIRDDFKQLWGTNFLDNLWIDARDYTFPNGVIGKIITYNMEERQRVKIVDYVGSKKIETSKIEDKLKEANSIIRLDTFIDPSLVRKVQGIVKDMLKEKGFQFATVTPEIQEMSGGPKLVHLTFHMDEGPKVKIRKLTFVGNKAMSAGALKRQMKENKEQWWLSFISGRGTYQENKYEEDADKVTQYYRDHGYLKARVGEPEIKFIEDSKDKKTRWIELRIPVTEGQRYKVGDFAVAGNTVVKSEFLKPLFKLEKGEYYSEKKIRKGLEKAQEIYGTGGYMEFTGYPEYKFSDDPAPGEPEAPAALKAGDGVTASAGGQPTVDVTMQIREGKQYFVNRITFTG
ncbi:MAG TPA: POTRA domain-containing protein, partial [Nitrospirales bacterium]|nr:POTRA domain-containing protein [Nitrospirales bacterium]